ncbi:MAG TPA: N-acetylneuraminate synthase [Candidatus Sulfotelmatobacter sp.]|jgi:N-acetylneuraminate synthase/N,N'-diacetyllegionaminate synthase
MEIGGKKIGSGNPCFVIAEAGVNHNGSLETGLRLVDAAVEAGADAVKFQTFKAEKLISAAAPKADYQKATTGSAEAQLEMVRGLEMPEAMTYAVAEHAARRRIIFLSTAFDEESADLLMRIGVPAFKVSSGDVTDLPLLAFLGRKRKPVILSTGMSYLEEVESAVETLLASGCPELALLHCVSSYPATPESANLKVIPAMKRHFNVPVGFSDHSLGNELAIAAVALEADIIEKHITLDINLPGPDHKASLAPDAFKNMARSIRLIEAARGDGVKRPTAAEQNVRDVARRSIVAARTIARGEVITREMLAFKRPGTGISPADWKKIVGRSAAREICFDTPIAAGDLA